MQHATLERVTLFKRIVFSMKINFFCCSHFANKAIRKNTCGYFNEATEQRIYCVSCLLLNEFLLPLLLPNPKKYVRVHNIQVSLFYFFSFCWYTEHVVFYADDLFPIFFRNTKCRITEISSDFPFLFPQYCHVVRKQFATTIQLLFEPIVYGYGRVRVVVLWRSFGVMAYGMVMVSTPNFLF